MKEATQTWSVEPGTSSIVPSEWTRLQDRGGLVHISDDLFYLLREMEMVSGSILKRGIKILRIREAVTDAIMSSEAVQGRWETLVCDIAVALETDLLSLLITKFSALRCFAYAAMLNRKLKFHSLDKIKPSSSLLQALAMAEAEYP